MSRASFLWNTDVDLGLSQLLYVVASGEKSVDPASEDLLANPVRRISECLLNAAVDIGQFWRQLRENTSKSGNLLTSPGPALVHAGCSELLLEGVQRRISGLLTDARHDFNELHPRLSEQIDLRSRPLRDRWETCGYGLVRRIERRFWGDEGSAESWGTGQIQLTMIQPARGGDGGADLSAKKVWMEAVLTDVDLHIPEVLRLTWLVTSLLMERSLESLDLSEDSRKAYRLALLILVLNVAVEFDLISGELPPVSHAMKVWRVGHQDKADTLATWWDEYGAGRATLVTNIPYLTTVLD